jgi:hypothetical protein
MQLKTPEIVKQALDRPIRAFALLCVAVTSGFFGYLAYWLITILSSPDWCSKAVQADRITPGTTFVGLVACMDLLKMQVAALAKTLLIVIGTFALCLGVLMVIVVAGARLVGKLFGNEIDVDAIGQPRGAPPSPSTTPAVKAATEVAGAAVAKADEIATEEPRTAQAAPGEDG